MASWDAYRNLNDRCWSYRHGGNHVEHADRLIVLNPRFVVQPAGNARVRAEHAKNVHAFVRSDRKPIAVHRDIRARTADWVRVTYDPYRDTTFVDAEDRRPITSAAIAVLDITGRCYVEAPVYAQEDPA